MATLYELNNAINNFDFLIDEETGEIKNFEDFELLQERFEDKCEAYAVLIKENRAIADAIAAEVKTLNARKKTRENLILRLTERLGDILDGRSIETARAKMSWRSSEAVAIEDGATIPEQYTKTEIKPDKTALKKALKAGEVFDGITLQTKNNLQIK